MEKITLTSTGQPVSKPKSIGLPGGKSYIPVDGFVTASKSQVGLPSSGADHSSVLALLTRLPIRLAVLGFMLALSNDETKELLEKARTLLENADSFGGNIEVFAKYLYGMRKQLHGIGDNKEAKDLIRKIDEKLSMKGLLDRGVEEKWKALSKFIHDKKDARVDRECTGNIRFSLNDRVETTYEIQFSWGRFVENRNVREVRVLKTSTRKTDGKTIDTQESFPLGDLQNQTPQEIWNTFLDISKTSSDDQVNPK